MQKAITSVRICNPHMVICHYGFVIHRKVKQKVTDIQQSDFQLLQDSNPLSYLVRIVNPHGRKP